MDLLRPFPKNYRYLLITLALLSMIGSGYLMTSRELWSHESLFFYGGLWLLLTSIFSISKPIRDLLLLTSSPLLLTFGFPPFPAITCFVGLIPLFYYLEGRKAEKIWPTLLGVYLVFLGYNIFSTYWVANSSFFAGMFAFFVNSFLMTLPFLVVLLMRKGKEFSPYIVLPFWLAFEFFHYRWGLSWPWLTVGNSLSTAPFLIQWYEYVGVLGGTLWIWVCNAELYLFWKSRSSRKIVHFLFLFLVPIIVSFVLINRDIPSSDKATITVVNPNIEPHFEEPSLRNSTKLEKLFSLLEPENLKCDMMVIPETFLSQIDLTTLHQSAEIDALVQLSRTNNLAIQTGAAGYEFFDDEPDRPSLRRFESNGTTKTYEVYNNSLFISPSGEFKIYNKKRFVPGAENFPFRSLLGFLQPLVRQLGGTIEGLGEWPRDELFEFKQIRTAPIICYEADYGEYCTGFVRLGANLFTVPSEDGWWGNTAGHKQQWHINRLRCIELRRSMCRAANYGISGFIDPHGRIINRTKQYAQEAVLTEQIPLVEVKTFYSQYGDLIGRVSILTSLILIVVSIVKSFKIV